ncbi:hypothetical protein AC80_1023 [Escherichia coli 1-110-08_S4_C1]|nr:hypothetical protein AC80_1023 [Escherichia coli 1-110-08_S4_C1]
MQLLLENTNVILVTPTLDKKPLWGWDGGSNPLVQKFS